MPYGGTIHSTISADLIQTDVDALIEGVTGDEGKTLSDLQTRLRDISELVSGDSSGVLTGLDDHLYGGLFDTGTPYLQMLMSDLNLYLYNSWVHMPWQEMMTYDIQYGLLDSWGYPWLETLFYNIDYSLNDYWMGSPWLQTIAHSLDYYLYNYDWGYEPWLQTVNNTLEWGFYHLLYDDYGHQSWLQTIHDNLDDYLYDASNARPWMASLQDEISALRTLLEDVHDSAQHALRTV